MLKISALIVCALIVVGLVGLITLTQPVLFIPKGKTPPAVDPADLERHVRALSEELYPRSYDNAAVLAKNAHYIENHFVANGARVSRQTWMAGQDEYTNIIAEFGPEAGPLIVIGAHYDAVCDDDGVCTPGADDNASGVAGLLALSDLLKEASPGLTVQLVAYCLEEPPFYDTLLMGSAVHAARLKERQAEVKAMLCLEMIGYFSEQPDSQTFPARAMGLIYPSIGNFIGVVGRVGDVSLTRKVKIAMQSATDLPVYSINAVAAIPGVDYSDHRNYWEQGYTAVMITDTAFYRNPAYHTTGDTPDRLDYVRMSQVVQGLFAAVMKLTGT